MSPLTYPFYSEICHGKWHKDVLENPLLSTSSSPKQWAVISTVYSMSHRQFPELTTILFWCSTKLPVLPYSPLYRCYIPQLFVTATKQPKDSRNRGFLWVYIPRTPSPFEEAIDQAWLNTFARSYQYVHTSAQMSTKVHDRSCCMTAVHSPTFIYHQLLRIWNVLASWFSNTFESQNTKGTRTTIFAIISENDQQMAQDQTYLRSTSCFIFSS